ncbi:IS66 family insertion sequence element accessory protein TnpA [Rhinopithecimicrobium faecis]
MSIQEKREQMLLMIADWLQSGKSKKSYCVENGINASKFYYWVSRIKESDNSGVGFLTIDRGIKHSDIEIMYPNGVRIVVENDLALVSQLIRLY